MSALAVVAAASALAVSIVSASASSSIGGPPPAGSLSAQSQDNLGIRPGKIKHVWLIILENKAYDATSPD